jgi:hypothetical protein
MKFTQERKDNIRKIALEKGYGKWMIGKKLTEEHKRNIGLKTKGKPFSGIKCDWVGRHHSEESRQKMSLSAMGKIRNKGGYKIKDTSKMNRDKIGIMPKNLNRETKFGNVKRGYYNINGKNLYFRSRWEANYALYLDFLVKQKQILSWEYEKDVFIFHKIQFGTRSYRPDFKVENLDGTFWYHEVKGWMDSQSKTKLKRMAKYYPETKIILVDSPYYKDLERKIGSIIGFY